MYLNLLFIRLPPVDWCRFSGCQPTGWQSSWFARLVIWVSLLFSLGSLRPRMIGRVIEGEAAAQIRGGHHHSSARLWHLISELAFAPVQLRPGPISQSQSGE